MAAGDARLVHVVALGQQVLEIGVHDVPYPQQLGVLPSQVLGIAPAVLQLRRQLGDRRIALLPEHDHVRDTHDE